MLKWFYHADFYYETTTYCAGLLFVQLLNSIPILKTNNTELWSQENMGAILTRMSNTSYTRSKPYDLHTDNSNPSRTSPP